MSTDTQTLPTPHKREVVPPNYVQRLQQAGVQFKKPEPKVQFLTDFASFHKNAGEFELQATKYLYENPSAGEHEYAVHCHLLGALISDGSALIVFSNCNHLMGLEAEKEFLQKKVDAYIATLHDWHGAPGTHVDEPPAFRASMEDYAKGKFEEGDL